MAKESVLESTLSFHFDDPVYENAGALPTLYRSLGLEPRKAHPFWIYEAIQAQGRLVAETLESIPPVAEKIASAFITSGRKRILFTGIGASYNLAISAALIFGELTGLPCEWAESSEAVFSGLPYDYASSLVFGLSASGNSREVVEHARQAKAAGALVVAMTNLDHTRLVHESDLAFVAAGGYGLVWDYTTRLSALAYLANDLAGRLGRAIVQGEAIRKALKEIPAHISSALQQIDDRCQRIGREIAGLRAAVVPGSGNLLPVAWETALRFEEMAHFPARGRPVVDFLHGGVGFLEKDIVTLLPAAPGPAYEASLRAARVTRELKTLAVGIVDQSDTEIARLVDEVVRLPETHPVLRPLVYLLPAQLIPYYTEIARPGGNPDVQRTDRVRYARAFDVAYPPKSH